ncbi:MAG TPA: hypothetical protein VEP50_03160 [bacterium]|nr:hypothetical protein [bacterium]
MVEMGNFKVGRSPSGKTTYTASVGRDDWVLAVSLAAWGGEQKAKEPVFLPSKPTVNFWER